ncbi:hypothetical protein Tco_1338239 [Tanacetum coccineum]
MSMTIQSSVKDKILATLSETSKVENAPAEMLRDLDQQMEKRADDGEGCNVKDVTRENELSGSNLVQETTNEILIIQERLVAAKLLKELVWKTFELMLIIHEVFVKLLLKSSGKLSIKHGLYVTIVCYVLLAIVVDRGTRFVPLFVVLERDRLKALVDYDIIESVISCKIAEATWTDLVHSFESPSDTKENKIIDLKLEYQTFRAKPSESLSQTYTRYKTLLNELANDDVILFKHEIDVGFMNSLPEKWLTFSQGLRNANHTLTLELAYIYESQPEPKIQKDYKTEYKKMKGKLALLEASPSTSHNPKTSQSKNKGLVVETFDWDEE